MSIKSLALVSFALAGMFIAAQGAKLGAAPARYMTGGELSLNGSKPARIVVTGKLLEIQTRKTNPIWLIQLQDGYTLKVVVRPEAGSPIVRVGRMYRIEGEVLNGEILIVSLPNSIQQLPKLPVSYNQTLAVKNQIAYTAHGNGTSRVFCPNVPDGVHKLEILLSENGNKQGVL